LGANEDYPSFDMPFGTVRELEAPDKAPVGPFLDQQMSDCALEHLQEQGGGVLAFPGFASFSDSESSMYKSRVRTGSGRSDEDRQL
jgi:hypothetical protein